MLDLFTRSQYNKARELLIHDLIKGPSDRVNLLRARGDGTPRAALEVALRDLEKEGQVEELYTLPKSSRGNKARYWVLNDWHGELPTNTVRYTSLGMPK